MSLAEPGFCVSRWVKEQPLQQQEKEKTRLLISCYRCLLMLILPGKVVVVLLVAGAQWLVEMMATMTGFNYEQRRRLTRKQTLRARRNCCHDTPSTCSRACTLYIDTRARESIKFEEQSPSCCRRSSRVETFCDGKNMMQFFL